MALTDVIKTALDQLQFIAKTETVVGEPIIAGGITLIPVSRVSIGFAAGGGGNEAKAGSGAGTGGGVSIVPLAFIAIREGRVEVHPVTPRDPFLQKIFSAAPDLIKKVAAFMGKGSDKKPDPSDTPA